MNDKSEQRFGENLIDRAFEQCRKTLDDRIRKGITDSTEVRAALDSIESRSQQIRGSYKPLTTSYFVICLSESGDQLSQWRVYGRDGYALEFDTNALLNHVSDVPNTGTSADAPLASVMKRVAYGEDGLANLVPLIHNFAQQAAVAGRTVDHSNFGAGHSNACAEAIAQEGIYCKDDAFSEEKEVRLLIGGYPELHTPTRYGMVPRKEIPLPHHLIKSVMVGPNLHAELQELSLESYAVASRWWNPTISSTGQFDVSRSRIPYRA
ncbi:DUF2971 domain-containing protein [Williamsia muralis]|uniref:DUF2971 domain-containing protein n=1 Tax=Williamsia marianensis TaxID=85044 RepID=UPI0014039ACA|nr:DUF2971 domain-containing protein [Williamsia marianensis]